MVGALQIGACVSGRSVSLLVMCPWFFHRPERALGVYLPIFYDTVRSYILISHPDMQLFLLGCTLGRITLADAD